MGEISSRVMGETSSQWGRLFHMKLSPAGDLFTDGGDFFRGETFSRDTGTSKAVAAFNPNLSPLSTAFVRCRNRLADDQPHTDYP